MGFNIEMFNSDERILINGISQGIPKNELTHDFAVKILKFGQESAASDDIYELTETLIKKVASLSKENWESLKMLLPLQVPYTQDDMDE